jgi:hypothetical protein
MVDAINVTGDEALVADAIGAYRQASVDVPVVFPSPGAQRARMRWTRCCRRR